MFTGSTDGKLYVYDILKGEPVKTIGVTASGALSALGVWEGGIVGGGHDGNVYYCKF